MNQTKQNLDLIRQTAIRAAAGGVMVGLFPPQGPPHNAPPKKEASQRTYYVLESGRVTRVKPILATFVFRIRASTLSQARRLSMSAFLEDRDGLA